MTNESSKSANPIELAKRCLGSPGNIEILRIYQFDDDEEAQDDEKQENLQREFEAAFFEAVKRLETEFGEARIAESEDEIEAVPHSGVFCAAFWVIDNVTLVVAAAHEDRETPYLIIIDTIQREADKSELPKLREYSAAQAARSTPTVRTGARNRASLVEVLVANWDPLS
jgi:hypothetical protein